MYLCREKKKQIIMTKEEMMEQSLEFLRWCLDHNIRYDPKKDKYFAFTATQEDFPQNFAKISGSKLFNEFLKQWKNKSVK